MRGGAEPEQVDARSRFGFEWALAVADLRPDSLACARLSCNAQSGGRYLQIADPLCEAGGWVQDGRGYYR